MIYRTDFDKITQQRVGQHQKKWRTWMEQNVSSSKQRHRREHVLLLQKDITLLRKWQEMFKITIKHVGVMTRENKTPKIALKNFNFYEKNAIDILYNQKA